MWDRTAKCTYCMVAAGKAQECQAKGSAGASDWHRQLAKRLHPTHSCHTREYGLRSDRVCERTISSTGGLEPSIAVYFGILPFTSANWNASSPDPGCSWRTKVRSR